MSHDGSARRRDSTDSEDLISRVDIADFNDEVDYQLLTTSAVLYHCKRKILKPYLRLLAVMGLRPFTTDDPHVSKCISVLGYVHLFQVILFMIAGYVLQYMACFRRDRGFCYQTYPLTLTLIKDHKKICYGSILFSYIIPSIIHFSAYLNALYTMRFKETERLESLMERTFLLSAHNPNNPSQQSNIVRNLWVFILLSIIWMLLSLISFLIMMSNGDIVIQWVDNKLSSIKILLEVLLVVSTLWHDMVQATIITSYCLQIQLLTSNLYFLKTKLLQHTIQPLNWVREINEFRDILNYLNNEFAPAVCCFTFVNMSWACAGGLWLLKFDRVDNETQPITFIKILTIILWVLMTLAPFIMAARLTTACFMLKTLGHEVRIRPFVYQDTPSEDLDTILLYTSSLKMKAKLFKLPIRESYLFFLLSVSGILVLTLGQCHVLDSL